MGLGTIRSISGRAVRVDKGREGMVEYQIAPNAEVTINEVKAALADLSNGDEVLVANGDKDGFHRVTATRSEKVQQALTPSKAVPTPVRVNEESGQVEPVPMDELIDREQDKYPPSVTKNPPARPVSTPSPNPVSNPPAAPAPKKGSGS